MTRKFRFTREELQTRLREAIAEKGTMLDDNEKTRSKLDGLKAERQRLNEQIAPLREGQVKFLAEMAELDNEIAALHRALGPRSGI